MTRPNSSITLIAVGLLAAVVQLLASQFGLIGALTGGVLCGAMVYCSSIIFATEHQSVYLSALTAAGASILGLTCRLASTSISLQGAAWLGPGLALLPFLAQGLLFVFKGKRCQLCNARLRGLLSFRCARCTLIACENCWVFEADRCNLCEANHAPLFPVNLSWWQEHFGSQIHSGRCGLCLRSADWTEAHWPCPSCGHGLCRSCWDDSSGRCHRCGWLISAHLSAPQESAPKLELRKSSVSAS